MARRSDACVLPLRHHAGRSPAAAAQSLVQAKARSRASVPPSALRCPLQAYGADILQALADAPSLPDQAAASSSREASAASPADAAGPHVLAEASGAASQAEASSPAASAPALQPDSGEAGGDTAAAAQQDVVGAGTANAGPGVPLCGEPGVHAAGGWVTATAIGRPML